MTIASDLGFEIGKAYKVVEPDEYTIAKGVEIGDYITFTYDDGSQCPEFTFKGETFFAYIAGDCVEVVPETPETARPTRWRIVCCGLTLVDEVLSGGQVVTREAEFESKQAASGVMVVVRTADDYLRTICSSLLEEVQDLPDHSAKIAELEAENLSIAKQVRNMRNRINNKLAYSVQNGKEIERLLKEQRGD